MADSPAVDQQYDRIQMLKAFDETKPGVKGLNDSGLFKLLEIFVRPSEKLTADLKHEKAHQFQVHVIDPSSIDDGRRRKQIVEEVRRAAETLGLFQVVNHGVPLSACDGMIDGVYDFQGQDVDLKKKIIREMQREL